MADTVLTELKIHEFDSVEQMSQYESEIGENDIVVTDDTTQEQLNDKANRDLGNTDLAALKNLDSTLTWNGRAVVTHTNPGSIVLYAGSSTDYCGRLSLKKLDPSGGGQMVFDLGVTGQSLTGFEDGSLLWGDNRMSAMCMPSGTYIDLTLGSSGSKYTAPADGWVCLNKKATGTQYSQITSGGLATASIGSSNSDVIIYLPVKAGNSFTVFYSLGGTTTYFRFVYAEGSKHLA